MHRMDKQTTKNVDTIMEICLLLMLQGNKGEAKYAWRRINLGECRDWFRMLTQNLEVSARAGMDKANAIWRGFLIHAARLL